MAILLDFQKTREDSREVEYIFGIPEKMDRRLVIEKASEQGRPLDGDRNHQFSAVFVKILRYHKAQNRWPAKGSYAA